LPKCAEHAILVPRVSRDNARKRYPEEKRLSIEAFKRIYWIVLDGMGMEHAKLFLESGELPGLSRIAREGVLQASAPSSPACQTPTALLALFSGAEPRESGIWGYLVPDFRKPTQTISGFAAPTNEIRTIWHDLEERGDSYSLMNVAFRNDHVWSGKARHLDFAYDGYRGWKKLQVFRVGRHGARVCWQGIQLVLSRTRNGMRVRKGSATKAELLPGAWHTVQLTRGLCAYACLLDKTHVVFAPLTVPFVRGSFRPAAAAEAFMDFNVFRLARRLNRNKGPGVRIAVSVEMAPVELGMRQKESLMIDTIRGTSSRLVIGYFPLVDELNHAWFDQLDSPQPDARVRELYQSCARLVDGLVSRVMAEAGPDDLVVLSSDHGVSAFRGTLHLNEIFARAGLVRRSAHGYDFRRSLAYYHPSDCGLVLNRSGTGRGPILDAIRRAVEDAKNQLGVRMGIVEARPEDPFIAFIYPLSDIYITARPLPKGGEILDRSRSGGQHLSPLVETPWINAMLGLWSPRSTHLASDLDRIPGANVELKSFLLGMLKGE
jgi:predicted AlkP superfamily pyrophosphatase or phosphodiesterase